MEFHSFSDVIKEAQNGAAVHVAVAAAHDKDVLLAVKRAVTEQLIIPHLVGNREKIVGLSETIHFSIEDYQIYDADDEQGCAFQAAQLANNGICHLVMKGMVNSTPFLKGVLDKRLSLRTGRVLSHLSIFEIPGMDELVFMTDGGLNIAPDVEQMSSIILNGSEFIMTLGEPKPKVALLAANERVNDKMPVTIKCQQVVERVQQSDWGKKVLIEGPLPLDLAISKHSLEHKGLKSELNGEADLLVVPDIEAGNLLGKSITYFAKGIMAGIVLGAKVPLILNSRSDSPDAKVASLALAVLYIQRANQMVSI